MATGSEEEVILNLRFSYKGHFVIHNLIPPPNFLYWNQDILAYQNLSNQYRSQIWNLYADLYSFHYIQQSV